MSCVTVVIPAMDKMHAELTAAAENVEYSPTLQAALELGKISSTSTTHFQMTLRDTGLQWVCIICFQYHSKCIYLVLHPKHKLRYFEKQNWEENWIKTAEEIVQEEFKQNYEEYLPRKQKTSQSQSSSKRQVGIYIYIFFFFFNVLKVFQSRNDDSDDSESSLSSSDEEEFMDELDRYLSSGHIKGVNDPIKWWHDNQGSYPRLS